MATNHVRPLVRDADLGPLVIGNRDRQYHPANQLRWRRTRRGKRTGFPTEHASQRITSSDTQFRYVWYCSCIHCILAGLGTVAIQPTFRLVRTGATSQAATVLCKKGFLAYRDFPRDLTYASEMQPARACCRLEILTQPSHCYLTYTPPPPGSDRHAPGGLLPRQGTSPPCFFLRHAASTRHNPTPSLYQLSPQVPHTHLGLMPQRSTQTPLLPPHTSCLHEAHSHPPHRPPWVSCLYKASAVPLTSVTSTRHIPIASHVTFTSCLLPPPGAPAGMAHLPPSLPTFTPERQGTAGLHLLASVASLAHTEAMPQPKPPPQGYAVPPPALSSLGPYNPVAVLPSKLAKRILELDFIEISEISLDDPPSQAPDQPPPPARAPVQDISVWMEKYSITVILLTSRFPEKAPELFTYLASIIQAERNFDDRRWVTYDCCFRCEALAQKSLDWFFPNASLYNEALTGRANTVYTSVHFLPPRGPRGTALSPQS